MERTFTNVLFQLLTNFMATNYRELCVLTISAAVSLSLEVAEKRDEPHERSKGAFLSPPPQNKNPYGGEFHFESLH